MPFLTLMGITLPVEEQSTPTVDLINQGEYGRAFSGVPYSGVRASSPEYKGRWPHVARSTSTTYGMLVRGRGQAYRFATAGSGTSAAVYSTKGLGPDSTVGTPQTFTSGGPVSNGGRLVLDSGEALVYNNIVEATLLQSTLSVWLKSTTGTSGTWKHYVVEYASSVAVAVWVNGVAGTLGTLPNDVESALSSYTLFLGYTGEQVQYGHAMCLPFRASLLESTWASYMYNSGTGRAAPDLPYLTMGGDWPAAGSDTVLGEVGQEQLRTGYTSGAAALLSSRDFTLRSTSTTS